MKKLFLVTLIVLLGTPLMTQASVINIPGDYPSIQAGIDAAVNSETGPTRVCDFLGCEVFIPLENFTPGDEFYCDILICNPFETTFTDVPLYSLLEVFGVIFVLPPLNVDATPGISIHTIIDPFFWPENAGEGSATIYAAMTDENVTELLGQFGYFAFTWSE